MAMMLTLDTKSETNIPKTLPSMNNSSNLREASFSSYLNGTEEKFVLHLSDSSKNCKPLISTPFDHLHLVTKKAEDTEIDIFSADKYFSERVDDETPRIPNKHSPKFERKMDPPPESNAVKQQNRQGTPSIRSESSWNSQNALLRNIQRNQQQPQKTNKINRKSFLANIGCNCSCGDKNSVDIDNPVSESTSNRRVNGKPDYNKARQPTKPVDLVSLNESQTSTWIREDSHCSKSDQLGIGLSTEGHFRFPDSNLKKTGDTLLEMQRKGEEDDTARKSLEVFGSPIQRKGKKSLSLERSLNMLSWDAIVAKVDEIEIPASSNGMYNDADSDASSDLFEIESFSTNPGQYLTRQGSTNSITPTTCYAPSEASIEWSVVTASAADFSVMSDSEELRTTTTKANRHGLSINGRTTPGRGEMPKRRSGILSGCYSQKAVRVAGDVYRTSERTSPGRHQMPEFLTPMTRFHAESEVARFDKRNGNFSNDTRLLTCSQSGRATDLLYKL